jgi:hypothetical protein
MLGCATLSESEGRDFYSAPQTRNCDELEDTEEVMGRLKGHSECASKFLKRLADAISGTKPEARGEKKSLKKKVKSGKS